MLHRIIQDGKSMRNKGEWCGSKVAYYPKSRKLVIKKHISLHSSDEMIYYGRVLRMSWNCNS